jgi:hypothetical protein
MYMSLIWTVVSVLVGALVVIWLVNRRAFRDIWKSGRAQVGKLGSAARSADPKAIWEQELRDARDELNHSISDLEESKALVTELGEQVKLNMHEVALLDSKVKNSLKDDPKDTRGKAAEYVVQLENAQANLVRNQDQLTKAQTLYANNLKKFQLANKKIRDKEEHGRQLGQEVKSSETNARLARLAQKFHVDVGALDNRLNEAEADMRKQIARNNAVSEVQIDLGISGVKEAEEEERLAQAAAKSKLDEYRKKMGL